MPFSQVPPTDSPSLLTPTPNLLSPLRSCRLRLDLAREVEEDGGAEQAMDERRDALVTLGWREMCGMGTRFDKKTREKGLKHMREAAQLGDPRAQCVETGGWISAAHAPPFGLPFLASRPTSCAQLAARVHAGFTWGGRAGSGRGLRWTGWRLKSS